MLQAESPDQILTTTVPRPRPEEPHRAGKVNKNWWIYLLLTLGLVVMMAPFVWALFSFLKTRAELARIPPTWFPLAPTLSNYNRLFTEFSFPTYSLNSVILAVSITVLNLLLSSMLGYALAKLKFAGKNMVFLLVLLTLMIPTAVTLVPLFVLMNELGLVNTLAAVILPESAQAIGIFLIIIILFLLQRYFTLGITMTGLKG